MKATKNNGTFEALNTAEGMQWIATRGDLEIWLSPFVGDCYLATLYVCERPRVSVEGCCANSALGALIRECMRTPWTEEGFGKRRVHPLGKDLYDFMKRPPRETYNAR